jgi:hypothetical protein
MAWRIFERCIRARDSRFKTNKNPDQTLSKKFDEAYRDIRNTVFAHTLTKDNHAFSKLFGNTKIPEIVEILYVLKDLLDSLWELYHNGRRLEFGRASKDYLSRIEQTTHKVLLELTRDKKA